MTPVFVSRNGGVQMRAEPTSFNGVMDFAVYWGNATYTFKGVITNAEIRSPDMTFEFCVQAIDCVTRHTEVAEVTVELPPGCTPAPTPNTAESPPGFGPTPNMLIVDEVSLGQIRSADAIHHHFVQDPNEQARLCQLCGMWPEHHNHGRGRCVCVECMPDADAMPDDNHFVPYNDSARQDGQR